MGLLSDPPKPERPKPGAIRTVLIILVLLVVGAVVMYWGAMLALYLLMELLAVFFSGLCGKH